MIGKGAMVLNISKRKDLDQMSGRRSLLRESWGTGTSCPEKLWMPCPWKCSVPGWKGP